MPDHEAINSIFIYSNKAGRCTAWLTSARGILHSHLSELHGRSMQASELLELTVHLSQVVDFGEFKEMMLSAEPNVLTSRPQSLTSQGSNPRLSSNSSQSKKRSKKKAAHLKLLHHRAVWSKTGCVTSGRQVKKCGFGQLLLQPLCTATIHRLWSLCISAGSTAILQSPPW